MCAPARWKTNKCREQAIGLKFPRGVNQWKRTVSPTTNLDCLCDRPAKVALCACYPPQIHDGISDSVLPISALRRIETTSCAVDAEGHVNATTGWVSILILSGSLN